MCAPVSGNEEKTALKLQPVAQVVVDECAVHLDAQTGTPVKEMNAFTVVLRRSVGVEFRMKTPPAKRLAEKQASRILPEEIVFMQGVVIDIADTYVASQVKRKRPVGARLQWKRFLLRRPVSCRLIFLCRS